MYPVIFILSPFPQAFSLFDMKLTIRGNFLYEWIIWISTRGSLGLIHHISSSCTHAGWNLLTKSGKLWSHDYVSQKKIKISLLLVDEVGGSDVWYNVFSSIANMFIISEHFGVWSILIWSFYLIKHCICLVQPHFSLGRGYFRVIFKDYITVPTLHNNKSLFECCCWKKTSKTLWSEVWNFQLTCWWADSKWANPNMSSKFDHDNLFLTFGTSVH